MKNKVLDNDLQLAIAMGLSTGDFEIGFEDISPILNEFNKTKEQRKNLIINHQPFVGIKDLGSPLLMGLHSEFHIASFDELVKAIGLLHGTNSYNANENWLIDIDNPSLNDCVCFKEDMDAVDCSIEKYVGFTKDVKFLPSKEWVVMHTKIIVSVAKSYLMNPKKFYMAYLSIHKNVINNINLDKDLVQQLIYTKDIEVETVLLVLIDALEHGYKVNELMMEGE